MKASPGVSWRSNRSSSLPPAGIPRERGRPTRILFPPARLFPPIRDWPQPDSLNGVLRQSAPDCREMLLLAILAIGAAGRRPPAALGSCPASVGFFGQPRRPHPPHHPGRRGAATPFPLDGSGRDGQGCAGPCAGGTSAIPGGRHSMPRSLPCAKMALREERDGAVPVSRNKEREKVMIQEDLTRNFQALEKRVRDIRSYL